MNCVYYVTFECSPRLSKRTAQFFMLMFIYSTTYNMLGKVMDKWDENSTSRLLSSWECEDTSEHLKYSLAKHIHVCVSV